MPNLCIHDIYEKEFGLILLVETPAHITVTQLLDEYFQGVVEIIADKLKNNFAEEWKQVQLRSFFNGFQMMNPLLLSSPCVPASPTPRDLAVKFFDVINGENYQMPIPLTFGPNTLNTAGLSDNAAPFFAGELLSALLGGNEIRSSFLHSGLMADLRAVHMILVNQQRTAGSENKKEESEPILTARTKVKIRRVLLASLVNPEALISAIETAGSTPHRSYGIYL